MNPEYNYDLPASNVTWQGGDYLNVVPSSAITALDTLDPAKTTIGTTSTANHWIRINMKNATPATQLKIYFTTDADPDWSEPKSKTITISANDTTYHEYDIDMHSVSGWSGTLRDVEVQPCRTATTGSVSIDWIHITPNDSATIGKGWEFQAGAKLVVAEASPSDNWGSWTIYDLLPGVSVSYDSESFSPDVARYTANHVLSVPVLEQGAPGTEMMKVREFSVAGDDYVKLWDFAADTVGWSATNQVSSSFVWSSSDGGVLSGTSTGTTPQIVSANNLHIPIGSSPFSVTADNAWHPYDVSTTGWVGWTNQELTRLRLQPTNASGTFKVDWVRIFG